MSRRRLVYLHGFASSPRSSKAAYLADRAGALGIEVAVPDLNEPEFETLTLTRMIERAGTLLAGLPDGRATLVGSSLGGLVALLAAASPGTGGGARLDSMVLMAPAIDLVPGLEAHFGPERMREWEATGHLEVFHHADQTERRLHWRFMADARRYDAWAVRPSVPTLVFQGRHDDTVSAATVERWAAGRSHVRLRLLDDGHQLSDSLDAMWDEMRPLLAQAV